MTIMATLSWADRFALMDHFNPSDDQACAILSVTPNELSTARELRAAGTFAPNTGLNVNDFAEHFANSPTANASTPTVPAPATTAAPTKKPAAESFVKPESAGKRAAVPKKRGRKGDKIQQALLAVPKQPVPIETFMQTHGVSLAVLRQAKRFAAQHGDEFAKTVGTVNVRQDKATKVLMIWKD